jgi:hypothetical protein
MKPSKKKNYLRKKYLLNGIYGVDTFKEVKELFRADYIAVKDTDKEKSMELFRKYILAITFRSSPKSIATSLSRLRSVVKEEGGKYKTDTLNSFWLHNLHPFNSNESRKKEIELAKSIKSPFNDHIDGSNCLSSYIDNEFISCVLTGIKPVIKKSFKQEVTIKEAWERLMLKYEKKVPNPQILIYKSVTLQDKKIVLEFDYKK